MRTIAAPLSLTDYDKALLCASHVIYTLDTANSRYTVVARAGRVVVICDAGTYVGEVFRGTNVHLVGNTLFLRDNGRDRTVLRTTSITGYYVLEN